jgi:Raf kinase inhibitor-like YbhB/YbcL family protein
MTATIAVLLGALAFQPSSLADVIVDGPIADIRDLIAHGANVNQKDDAGVTVLMQAASAGRAEKVRLLVASGADVNARTSGGMTALMMAALAGYADTVVPLLAAKADATVKDNQGRTALMAAASSGEVGVMDALLEAGVDPNAEDASGGTALTYAAAEGHANALETLQKHGAKPREMELTLAAGGCATEVVRAFLATGLSPDVESGTSPLHAAAGGDCPDTVALLVARGANVNAKDNDGWTPMIKAASAGHVEIVRLLLDKGADMDVADSQGRTAWMYAAMGNHVDIADLFRAARGGRNAPARLDVDSLALKVNEPMPREYTADGHNWSPPLTWSDPPPGTRSLAVVCEDPDGGNPPPFVHWVIYNIPASAKGLPENVPFEPGAAMPASIAGAVQGVSGFRRAMYRGPAPPPGKPHHYHFVVYAIDAADLKPNLTRADLLEAIRGHVLGQGELVTVYERR